MARGVTLAAGRQSFPRIPVLSDFLSSIGDLFAHRQLVRFLILRDFRRTYKQSLLGYGWAFLAPLIQLVILSFALEVIRDRNDQDGVPFPVFLIVALVFWNFFTNSLTSATTSVSGARNLITKVYFPREILPISASLIRIFDLAVGLLIYIGVMLVYGQSPHWAMLWMPLLFVVQLILTLGIAFPLATINLFFRDVHFFVGSTLRLMFFATPIMYPVSRVEEAQFIMDVNPMAYFISAYRNAALHNDTPDFALLGIFAAISVGVFIGGYYFFKRMEERFADWA